jgi:hypothetical protein
VTVDAQTLQENTHLLAAKSSQVAKTTNKWQLLGGQLTTKIQH